MGPDPVPETGAPGMKSGPAQAPAPVTPSTTRQYQFWQKFCYNDSQDG